MELIINLLKDESMKAAIIGALGSIVGGFIGVIGSLIVFRVQRKKELSDELINLEEKYKKIIHDSYKKYGRCDFILIKKIFNKDSAILIQNAFPIIEKYIDHVHKEGDEVLCLDKNLQNLIFKKFNKL